MGGEDREGGIGGEGKGLILHIVMCLLMLMLMFFLMFTRRRLCAI